MSIPVVAPVSAPAHGARPTSPLAGVVWMTVAAALFSVMNLLARTASSHVPWQEVVLSRTVVGALVAFIVARSRGASLTVHDRKLGWARTLFGTSAMLCAFYTITAPSVPLGDAATLSATAPIFVALLSPLLLGERGGPAVWVSTLLAFVGVLFVAGPTFELSAHVAAVATLGALFTALAMISLRKLSGSKVRESPEAIALHFSLVAAAVALVVTVPVWRTPDSVGAVMLVSAGVTGGLAQLAMTRAYALDRATRIGTIGYLTPVLSHVLGTWVLNEPSPVSGLLGTALVIGAGLWLFWGAMREGRAVRATDS